MRTSEPISEDLLSGAERQILHRISTIWSQGWQPQELDRQIRRAADAWIAELALFAIAADHSERPVASLDPRWITQLDAMNLPVATSATGWLDAWARRENVEAPELLGVIVALIDALETARPIEILIPPPGAAADSEHIVNLTTKTDDPVLNRVRALLAQAESTNFEAEAETFTAKAQELMTRHAIDMAMVAAGTTQSERPGASRLPIDAPYARAKWILLSEVARTSRCQAVFEKRFGLATVVGFDADLQATDTLFTSLLVQAQVALRAAGAAAASGDQKRTRTFRSSFLLAYACRVGERLEEINTRVADAAAAETGRDIVPVLAARSSVVDERVSELFPRLGTMRSRATVDPEGWASGRMAADRAKLNSGDLRGATRALH